MIQIECDHISEKYPEILQLILERGTEVSPRGVRSIEVSPLVICSSFPRKRLFGTPGRNENPVFPYVEGLWILTGDDSPDMLSHYVRQTRCYVNERTGKFDGAYGPRLRSCAGLDQFDAVYQRLLRDRDSRRAVMTIFNPLTDNSDNSLDVPCTLTWQFLIRDDKLNMICYMRSNDLFRGFVYDTIEFQWFQEILAGWLGVDVGTYVHVAGSAHIYRADESRVTDILRKSARRSEPFSLYNSSVPQDARLSKTDFEKELGKLRLVEEKSRSGLLFENDCSKEIMDAFQCGFYRNLALAIAGFNAHKHRKNRMSTSLINLIDNDLGTLMRNHSLFANETVEQFNAAPVALERWTEA